ncbi:hypothetical protein [Kozakia baliensis]|uniref:hypothetical protein n=1 Tax=Kozakia baliensis TaxID=153496 RepID=UPI00049858F2|nr:hypothetical protein [Kozakia baliensis]AOX19626.1 hypothetical protein A0U90_04280 [Kozakia baliensis]
MAAPDTSTPPRFGTGRRKPRTLRQHIARRLLVLVPASLLAVVVMKMGWLEQAADRLQFDKLAWFDNTKLVEHLRVTVTHDGLTDVPSRCLVPVLNGDDPPNATRVDFMSKGTKGCPAKPGSFEKLFTIKVDRADRILYTDAGSPGQFRLLSR